MGVVECSSAPITVTARVLRTGKIPEGYYDTLLSATKSDARGVALSRVPLETAGEGMDGGEEVACVYVSL